MRQVILEVEVGGGDINLEACLPIALGEAAETSSDEAHKHVLHHTGYRCEPHGDGALQAGSVLGGDAPTLGAISDRKRGEGSVLAADEDESVAGAEGRVV